MADEPAHLLAKHIATTQCIVYTRRLKNTERLARPLPVFYGFLHTHVALFQRLFPLWTYNADRLPNSKSPLYAAFRDKWLPLACGKLAACLDDQPIPMEPSDTLWDALYNICAKERGELTNGKAGPRAIKGWEPGGTLDPMSMLSLAAMYEQICAKEQTRGGGETRGEGEKRGETRSENETRGEEETRGEKETRVKARGEEETRVKARGEEETRVEVHGETRGETCGENETRGEEETRSETRGETRGENKTRGETRGETHCEEEMRAPYENAMEVTVKRGRPCKGTTIHHIAREPVVTRKRARS